MSDEVSSRAQARALILAEVAPDGLAAGVAGWLQRLCRAAARSLPASGVGVSVMSENGYVVVAASDPVSELVEDLQFSLGEGPCLDAYASRGPVLMSQLARDGFARWPGYTPAALAHGVQAVFAFPLQVGTARLGMMDVYRERPEPMSADCLTLTQAFADTALDSLIDQQEETDDDGRIDIGLGMENRHLVYQAQGMVMIQLGGVSMAEAMARLRAFAFAEGRAIGEVAKDVVTRKLVLEPDQR